MTTTDHTGGTLVDEQEPAEASGADDASSPPRRRMRRPGPSVILLLVAALVAASGLVAWWQTAGDEQLARAEQRDTVLVQARQGIEVMNTLDYREVAAGIAAWQDVTTGTLRDQLAAVDDGEQQLLADHLHLATMC